jgi:hypothetical protein
MFELDLALTILAFIAIAIGAFRLGYVLGRDEAIEREHRAREGEAHGDVPYTPGSRGRG